MIKKAFLLILSLFLCYGVAWISSVFTETSIDSWYSQLKKPFWTPPNLVFPIVWTILYGMIGLSFWLILCEPRAYKLKVFVSFFLQLLANGLWTFFFFYLESPKLGFIMILVLMCAIVWNMYTFHSYSRLATWLLAPYLLWVLYASTLNLGIWVLN